MNRPIDPHGEPTISRSSHYSTTGICNDYPVCGMVHIKTLAATRRVAPVASVGFLSHSC